MEDTQKCCQCFQSFTVARLPHSLPCTHDICDICLQEVQKDQEILICQFCQKTHQVRDLADLPFNENIRLELQEVKPPSEQGLREIHEQQGEILLEQTPTKMVSPAKEELCEQHRVVMDIICLTEQKRICPHCALFGSHKHHAFKRIEDFQKELEEKQHMFRQILCEKDNGETIQKVSIRQAVEARVEAKKEQLVREVNLTIQGWIKILVKRRQLLLQQIEQYFRELRIHFSQVLNFDECQKDKQRLQDWEHECSASIKQLDKVIGMEEKLKLYFNGPLQIISEGYIYLEKYNQHFQDITNKVAQKINLKLNIDADFTPALDKAIKLLKPGFSPINSLVREEDPNEVNPFLDCNSSGIMCQSMVPQHNLSIEQISSLTSSMKFTMQKGNEGRRRETMKPTLNQKRGQKKETMEDNAYRRKTIGSFVEFKEKEKSNQFKGSRTSQRMSLKSSQKVGGSDKLKLQTDQRHYDPKQPEKLFSQFKKNSLTDFFDLSDCNLPCQQVIDYVAKARKSHKIKGLKLCANNLDVAGFEKMVELLKGVSNINLANNQITSGIWDVLLKNRESFDLLRVINLCHNPLEWDRKSKAKLQQVKKMGVIVIL